jgi:membrane protein implicated in regulation of membrane protease activity
VYTDLGLRRVQAEMLLVVALVLVLVLPDPWNILLGAVAALLGLGEIYLWNRTVRHRRRAVGAQTLVGKSGTVRETCRPVGQVFVEGELWGARCRDGADVGDRVEVVAVDRLQLEVRAVS